MKPNRKPWNPKRRQFLQAAVAAGAAAGTVSCSREKSRWRFLRAAEAATAAAICEQLIPSDEFAAHRNRAARFLGDLRRPLPDPVDDPDLATARGSLARADRRSHQLQRSLAKRSARLVEVHRKSRSEWTTAAAIASLPFFPLFITEGLVWRRHFSPLRAPCRRSRRPGMSDRRLGYRS